MGKVENRALKSQSRSNKDNYTVNSTSSSHSKKKKKGKERQYSTRQLKEALNALGQGKTLRQVAHEFGVPRSTLHLKANNITPLECAKGPPTILTKNEESEIVQWILLSADRGFPVNKDILLDTVQRFLNDAKRDTVFTNNRPGNHWYKAFLRRHEVLSVRIAQNLTTTRASVTEDDLRNWFSHITKYLEKKELLDISPNRIFNLDESAFQLVPKDNSVITEKGSRSVYQIVSSNEKASLTVLFIASANGIMPPPLILYDSKTTPKKQILQNIPPGWGVGNSDKGWMTAETFYYFINNIFIKWLNENAIELPIILYVDGHVSHLSLPLMKLCKDNKIELIALYPNATHIIQPLDVAFFHPLKDVYKKTLRRWRVDNEIINFKKHMFPIVLKLALDSIDLSSSIRNGFKACGLYPLDASAVNYNILNKNKKKRVESSSAEVIGQPTQNVSGNELLDLYEKTILSEPVSKSFKELESAENWTGDPDYNNHFNFWKKMKTYFAKNVDQTTSTANVASNCDLTSADATMSVCNNESILVESANGIHLDFDLIDVFVEQYENSNGVCSALASVCDDSNYLSYQIDDVPSADQSTISQPTVVVLEKSIPNISPMDVTMDEVPDITVSGKNVDINHTPSGNIDWDLLIESAVVNQCMSRTIDLTVHSNSQSIIENCCLEEQVITQSRNSASNKEQIDSLSKPSVTLENSTADNSTIDADIFGTSDVVESYQNETVNEHAHKILDLTINSLSKNAAMNECPPILKSQDDNKFTESAAKPDHISQSDNAVDNVEKFICDSVLREKLPNNSNDLKSHLKIPEFERKKRNKTSQNMPPVSVVDDLLQVLQKKADIKKEKEEKVTQNKEIRERNKKIKEQNRDYLKTCQENIKAMASDKREILSKIKKLKSSIKTSNSKENALEIENQIKGLNVQLSEAEDSLLQEKVKILQAKKKVKEEL